MARDLGFLIHETKKEYVTLPKATSRRLAEEVRNELHLDDLAIIDPASPPRIINFFNETIPNRASKQISRWKIAAPLVRDHAATLRKETGQLTQRLRSDQVRTLRQKARSRTPTPDWNSTGRWSLPDLEPWDPSSMGS
jgi:hypothetical protein